MITALLLIVLFFVGVLVIIATAGHLLFVAGVALAETIKFLTKGE